MFDQMIEQQRVTILKLRQEIRSARSRESQLVRSLKELRTKIWNHHEIGHPAPVNFPGGTCPICTVGMFERADKALGRSAAHTSERTKAANDKQKEGNQ